APRQLTHTTGGAIWPDVAPDSQSIVFVGYTADGFDLFLTAYPNGARVAQDSNVAHDFSPAVFSAERVTNVAQDFSPAVSPAIAYRPWPTLEPTSWFPVVAGDSHQVRAGAATGGGDVLRYHAYAASATWPAGGTVGAE